MQHNCKTENVKRDLVEASEDLSFMATRSITMHDAWVTYCGTNTLPSITMY